MGPMHTAKTPLVCHTGQKTVVITDMFLKITERSRGGGEDLKAHVYLSYSDDLDMSGEEQVKDVSVSKRGSLPRFSGFRERFKKKSKAKPPSKWFGLVVVNWCGKKLMLGLDQG